MIFLTQNSSVVSLYTTINDSEGQLNPPSLANINYSTSSIKKGHFYKLTMGWEFISDHKSHKSKFRDKTNIYFACCTAMSDQ